MLQDEARRAGLPFDTDAYEHLRQSVNIRFATDGDTERVVQMLNGLVPIYRSVYRFTDFDPDDKADSAPDGRPVKSSAIVQCLFWEFEHKECGVLCEHTRQDVCRFINWLRRNRMEPWIIYSGGKSLHVYVLLEPLKLRRPHSVIKKVLKVIEQKARILFVDPNAMLGTSQMARVMNAMNPKSGLYAIPVRPDEVLQNAVSWIQTLAKKPRRAVWTPLRTNHLSAMMKDLDEQLELQEAMEALFPQPVKKQDGTMCWGIKATYESPPESEARGHKGLVGLLSHCRLAGMSMQEAVDFCEVWNRSSIRPMSRGYVRYQAEWVYKNPKSTSPCFIVVPFVGKCPVCCTRPTAGVTTDVG